MKHFFEYIYKIYEHISDDQSRNVFSNRLMYNLTKDFRYMKNIVKELADVTHIKEMLNTKQGKKIIFGAGRFGDWFYQSFSDIDWLCYADNYKCGDIRNGLPVITFDELCKKHKDAYIFVGTTLYHKEIEQQLLESGFPRENLLFWEDAMKELQEKQYFDLPYLKHDEEEVFLDIGAYDGETSKNFVKWCKGKYQKIYMLEPNKDMWNTCKIVCESLRDCELVTKGAWDETGKAYFFVNQENDQASHITNSGSAGVSVVALDDILGCERATFIKADIEGAELRCLDGAKRVIREFKPKMAFSIYHKAEDIYEIPLKLLEFNPEYRLYFRHYSFTPAETVVYAV